ncbi:[FeFe] hydrogenase H-cluster radical SAM maturase HydG [Anaerosacchariphilus polymeriproducens]|uniref:[FeFe] hydrogenase H-cluster radical SAM maturase HydG n=1 Tax=Anaerosacchariphilus polymeriproducens TaxID=1812858 RepID=UPI00196174AD|nr:[FeFe] hydrogenase H-cluster radical SAM maturase HydG [Anaerosacchariphilus polymeriproducens]
MDTKSWMEQVKRQDEVDRYLINGEDFIHESEIRYQLDKNKSCSKDEIEQILEKSLAIERLSLDETAKLLNVKDENLWEEMYEVAAEVKKRVYDNRLVFFAPLYCGNLCINSCKYCGFRKENKLEERKVLTKEEIKKEVEYILSQGHKRIIVVFGEHPQTDAEYIANSMKTIYGVNKRTRSGSTSRIRRINVNAAPMNVEDLKLLKEVGIGTYQVFQETYHKATYKEVHPSGLKADYRWRLYALHRAMDAGIDDVAIGALFGLYDWRFEVMGLMCHTEDLEKRFGIGPHTISFPRLTPASGSELSTSSKYLVNDADFKKIVTVLRLSVPYTGLIITAREKPEIRDDVINVGCTQLDASTKIGIGAYDKAANSEKEDKQQFAIGDLRTLDEVVKYLADNEKITSFCTAGYRCGRTGEKIMKLLESCTEGRFCKLNAILTYREYLDDYASEETKELGEKLIQKEIDEVNKEEFYQKHNLLVMFHEYYERIAKGERDLFI